jgi:hypothetical protein
MRIDMERVEAGTWIATGNGWLAGWCPEDGAGSFCDRIRREAIDLDCIVEIGRIGFLRVGHRDRFRSIVSCARLARGNAGISGPTHGGATVVTGTVGDSPHVDTYQSDLILISTRVLGRDLLFGFGQAVMPHPESTLQRRSRPLIVATVQHESGMFFLPLFNEDDPRYHPVNRLNLAEE